jgi:transposase
MISVASDVHKGRCFFAMIPEDGKLKMLEPIKCTREAWLGRLAELPPEAELALEVSTSGYFVMSVVEEAGWRERSHWVHTAGIDSLRKQKSDRLDTRRLVKKLAAHHADPLPEAWFPPAPIRELRLVARQRCRLARLRAQTRNRINSLLEMHGLRPDRCPYSAAGRSWIKSQKLSEGAHQVFEQLFRTLDFLITEVKTSEADLRVHAARFPEIARLETIPGLGHILAAVIWSEIGDLKRFDSADALVNYTGLVPSLYESAEVSIRGPITHQGPTWLRWALVTAANTLTRSKSPLGRRYWRLRRHRKHPNVAKVGVAVSVARCSYGVLKHGGNYQAERWGRRIGDELEQQA